MPGLHLARDVSTESETARISFSCGIREGSDNLTILVRMDGRRSLYDLYTKSYSYVYKS